MPKIGIADSCLIFTNISAVDINQYHLLYCSAKIIELK